MDDMDHLQTMKASMQGQVATGVANMRHICRNCCPSRRWTILAMLLLHILSSTLTSASAYPQFTEQSPGSSFQTIAMDAQTGTVYIGSVNSVYKLDSNLTQSAQAVTGPKWDSPDCVPPRKENCSQNTLMDNVNKVLLVDGDRLIVCGTVYQGVCDILSGSSLQVLWDQSMTEISVNTEYGATVAFLSDGPNNMRTMYVASSSSEWFRSNLWTLSSRQVPTDYQSSSLFKVYSDGGQSTSPTSIQIPVETIGKAPPSQPFNISYVSGFAANGFSYFVAVQPEYYDTPGPHFTKLARVCQQDDHFYSYVELPLRCYVYDSTGRTLYNLAQSAYVGTVGANVGSSNLSPDTKVLYVVFSRSDGLTINPTAESAVCMYPLSLIDQVFWERRLGCAMGVTDRTDIDWLGSAGCGTSPSMINTINATGPGYCHREPTNNPLGGSVPINARAVYNDQSYLTSIAATVHLGQTVIFVGDVDGNLKKLRLIDETTAQLYEELTIDSNGGMVKNGMVLSPDEDHVYVMTETKVTKIPVEECEAYNTFEECVEVGGGVGDPYCGWCVLNQRCTRRVECPGANDSSPFRWLTISDKNTQILDVTPPNTESDNVVRLTLQVQNLPILDTGNAYQCVFTFGGVEMPRPASVTSPGQNISVVNCYTPQNVLAPTTGYTQAQLMLRPTQTDTDVVITDFFFYKCSTFGTCGQCVAQEFGCYWCTYNNLCTGNASKCQPEEGIILGRGLSTNSPLDSVGPDYCPAVGLGNDTEILIHAGMDREIVLDVANLPAPVNGASYQCVFTYEDQELAIPAFLQGETALVCQSHVYAYETETTSVTGSMVVRWNGPYEVTASALPVVLYKCSIDRPNCGLCLSADPKFGCGWCSGQFECGLESQCPGTSEWVMGTDAICPDPTIREFFPMSGHLSGDTNLTIRGYNLGLVASDIRSITVAGISCEIDPSTYVPALQISCKTGETAPDRLRSGNIEVHIGNNENQMYTATSSVVYKYVVPKISGVSPSFGPASGGSLISIQGLDLDAGSESSASLDDVPCQIVSVSPDHVLCLSGPSPGVMRGYVSMTVDNHYVEATDQFQYRTDPVITKINRFSSISSGSLEMVVEGEGFDSIHWPQLSFMVGPEQVVTNCTRSSPRLMTCQTPDIRHLNATLPLTLPTDTVSFILDGVSAYAPLQNNGAISGLDEAFVFYPQPVYLPFHNGKMELEFEQRKFVMIEGANLTLSYREGDVRVTIGDEECTDVVVKQTQLTCYAPEAAPETGGGQKAFRVTVYHGSLVFPIGEVEYLSQAIPLALIVGSAAGGVLLLLFFLIMAVCILSYRKNHNNERIFKEMEEQRDALELTVAQECKEAFAELQTGVLSITHDIKGHGIPMLDYRSYVVKSLFPENPNHPVMRELSVAGVRKDYVHKGLRQFGQLLANKSFLMIFVRVLEEQRTLSTRDYSNVASLLVVAFHGKMEYCTVVLKALMARAIRQHVKEGEESTRVFMRRGVSVVEKMVGHWLAVLLYNHLQDTAGEPLFKLFYAIKQQVEKGPVDGVTGEARYSLTEGKLIRQQVNERQLTIKAQGPDRNTQMVEVRVMDCDTISQTKDKILDVIYKTAPYSQRQKKEELDLEWYDRAGGKLLLFDDDGLRPVEGSWRRLNTLGYYKVPDGATLFLLQAQRSSDSLHSNHSSPARSYNNINAVVNYQNIHHTPSSSMSPMITLEFENRLWHLVKPADHQNHQNAVNERKMMAEIYLPRLLTTKTILQKFVDDVFTTVFMVNPDGSSLPRAIKYLFDFLDEQAEENGIKDPAVIHAWKSNSLPLRFWVNLIKNPNMIFDIHKTDTVDSCLSVVAQCVMEACSVSEQQLNKNSPASKLLYAKDIPNYKEYVAQYYSDVQNMPAISDQDMNSMLADHSQRHQYDFYMLSALNELYFGYACKYRSELMSALDEDSTAKKQGHAEKIEEIERIMSKSF